MSLNCFHVDAACYNQAYKYPLDIFLWGWLCCFAAQLSELEMSRRLNDRSLTFWLSGLFPPPLPLQCSLSLSTFPSAAGGLILCPLLQPGGLWLTTASPPVTSHCLKAIIYLFFWSPASFSWLCQILLWMFFSLRTVQTRTPSPLLLACCFPLSVQPNRCHINISAFIFHWFHH